MEAADEGRRGGNKQEYSRWERLISGFPLQCIYGMVTATEKVVGDRRKAQSITAKVKELMCR